MSSRGAGRGTRTACSVFRLGGVWAEGMQSSGMRGTPLNGLTLGEDHVVIVIQGGCAWPASGWCGDILVPEV